MIVSGVDNLFGDLVEEPDRRDTVVEAGFLTNDLNLSKRRLLMPVPVPSAILLAAASISLIAGRNFRLRSSRFWGIFCLTGILLTAGYLLAETIPLIRSTDSRPEATSWTEDPLSHAEQWVVLAWGLLTSIAVFDSKRLDQERPGVPGFLLFVLAGLMLVAASNDLITLGLSLEIVSLASLATWRNGTLSSTPHKKGGADPVF